MSDLNISKSSMNNSKSSSMRESFLGTIQQEISQESAHISIVDETSDLELENPPPAAASRKLRRNMSAGPGSSRTTGRNRSPRKSRSSAHRSMSPFRHRQPMPDRSGQSTMSGSSYSGGQSSSRRRGTLTTSFVARGGDSSDSEAHDLDHDGMIGLHDSDFSLIKGNSNDSRKDIHAAPQSSSTAPSRAPFWKKKSPAVDQRVNLMDAETGQYEQNPSSLRNVMHGFRQKSLVDIFLTDDPHGDDPKDPQSRRSSGIAPRDSLSPKGRRRGGGGTTKWLVLACMAFLGIVALLTIPPLGILQQSNISGGEQSSPTTKPTLAPAEEEKGETPPPEEGEIELSQVPQDTRLHALEFYVMDQDVTTQEQLDIMGSPSKKALHWIAQKDPAKYPIPGLEPVTSTSKEVAEHALLQRYALAVFYFSMQATSSTLTSDAGRMLADSPGELANRKEFDHTWLSAKPICEWQGVTCDKKLERVIQVHLPGHLLQGTLPRELLVGGAMPYLKKLHLRGNQLQGSLPDVAPQRRNAGLALGVTPPASVLELLDLSDNQLSGSLGNLMEMTALKELDLSRNKLTGKIPKDIQDLSLLEDLTLSDNRLTGAVPAKSLANLTALKYLRLVGNSLTEELPATLAALYNLQEVRLSSNEFVGTIPGSYGGLIHLKLLHMDGNGLSGTVPTHLGRLTQRRELQLDGNALTGDMPQEICDLRGRSLYRLQTDCANGEIVCECCSDCY